MAYRITNACTACGKCINRCPCNAIYVTPTEVYAIEPSRCSECIDVAKPRCRAVCAARAIELDAACRETPEALWAKHRVARTVRGRTTVRTTQ